MKRLTVEEINKNKVNTINQFIILKYLKENININVFKIYLYDNKTIKIIDKNNKKAYFKYNEKNKKIEFYEIKNKELER